MAISINCNSCVLSLPALRLFFSYQIDDAAGKKKLLKPTWIGEKGREDSILPFALNQKTVGSPEEACSNRVMEKTSFF